MSMNASECEEHTTATQATPASARPLQGFFPLKSEVNLLYSYCTTSFLFADSLHISHSTPPPAFFPLPETNPIFFNRFC